MPKLPTNVQYILFSETLDNTAKDVIYEFVKESKSISLKSIYEILNESQSISLKTKELSLDKIVQFRADLTEKTKVDFLVEFHECCSITQCIVFVNTREFAVTVQRLMTERGLKANIFFCKGMEEEEREKVIEQFREQKINFLITTDLMPRALEMPNIKLIVNFDVPSYREIPDFSNYFHRISRYCRFVTKAAVVTLIDSPLDKRMMDEIVAYYSIQDKVQ